MLSALLVSTTRSGLNKTETLPIITTMMLLKLRETSKDGEETQNLQLLLTEDMMVSLKQVPQVMMLL